MPSQATGPHLSVCSEGPGTREEGPNVYSDAPLNQRKDWGAWRVSHLPRI